MVRRWTFRGGSVEGARTVLYATHSYWLSYLGDGFLKDEMFLEISKHVSASASALLGNC